MELVINKLNWQHILDKQPQDGEWIIQIEVPYSGYLSMGMRNFSLKCTFQELLDYYRNNELPMPNFWWISAKDFPFPDKDQ
jgi:hypothetical protein